MTAAVSRPAWLDAMLRGRNLAITDGAWGTFLQAKGLGGGKCPDEWNLTHSELVGEVAAAYVAAGSDIILTNTFGASSVQLERHGLAAQAEKINLRGVQISKQAAKGRALVFGSMGPSGKMLLTGEIGEARLYESFLAQAAALATGGADGLVIESMMDAKEAGLAIQAAKTTRLPVVACMVFTSGKHHDHTLMGLSCSDAGRAMVAAGADIVGANCGIGIEAYVPVCRQLHDATGLPVWIKPNAGLPEIRDGQVVYPTSPSEFAKFAKTLCQAGAAFIGGCCGTGPDHIRSVKAAFLNGRE